MKKGIIYVYFNKAKYEKEGVEKYYVGQTVGTMEQRAGKDGRRYNWDNLDCNNKFANGIRKWGWNSFEGRVLEEVYEEDLNELEKFYIEYFDSYKNGYNSTLGGEGTRGHNPYANKTEEEMEEIKEKKSKSLSIANKKRFQDPKLREKLSIARRKCWEDKEYREKQNIARRKCWEDQERRKKQSKTIKKSWENKELREKLSISQKKLWEDKEYREKQSETVKKHWKDQEYREKQNIARRKCWEDQERRKKQSKTIKKSWENKELREKLSISLRKRWEDKEYREKLSVARRKCWEDQEYREKQSIAQKKRFKSPEERQKISEKLSGEKSPCVKNVYCNELNIIFSYIGLAEKYCKNILNSKIGPIRAVCNGKRKSTGAYNGKKLTWNWIENVDKETLDNAEYIDSKKYEEIINAKINN